MRETPRMQALCSAVSHDLNNYVGAALGYLELIKMELMDEPSTPAQTEAMSLLGLVEVACAKIKALSSELCDYADLHPVYSQPYSLHEAVQHLLGEFPEGSLNFEPMAEDTQVDGDRALFLEALREVVVNAQEACAESSPASVTVRTFRGGEPPSVGVSVADNGIGIAETLVDRIFDPCYTTKGKGRGFGLARAQARVARIGAVWQVRSHPGQGSQFTILWPSPAC